MVNIFLRFVRFPSFISNTSIVSINFRANLDAQNAGNAFPGFKKIFWGVCPQTPLGIHAWYVGHMAIPH
jgi:hypothetical protein